MLTAGSSTELMKRDEMRGMGTSFVKCEIILILHIESAMDNERSSIGMRHGDSIAYEVYLLNAFSC